MRFKYPKGKIEMIDFVLTARFKCNKSVDYIALNTFKFQDMSVVFDTKFGTY